MDDRFEVELLSREEGGIRPPEEILFGPRKWSRSPCRCGPVYTFPDREPDGVNRDIEPYVPKGQTGLLNIRRF